MKKLTVLLISIYFLIPNVHAQLNVELLHQLVAESRSEYSRQENAKNKQIITTANEGLNRTELTKLKSKYQELQNRFHTLGLAVDAAQISIQAMPIVKEIIRQQSLIFDLAGQNPLLILLAFETEIDLADRAHRLSRFLFGLILSIGDINQMKASDRNILFAHILTELRKIEGTSRGLAANLIFAKQQKPSEVWNPFREWINIDKQLIDNILRNAKALKNNL